MVRLGMGLDGVHTALDLEEGLAYLQRLVQQPRQRQSPAMTGRQVCGDR